MNVVLNRRVPRPLWVLLVLSSAALATSAAFWLLRPPALRMRAVPVEELRRQSDALRVYDDGAAGKAAADIKDLRSQLWSDARLDEWKRTIRAGWILQEAQPQQNESTTTRRFVLTRSGASDKDWTEIYRVIQNLSTLPTVVLHGLRLSVPQPSSRQFKPVEAVIDLWFEKSESPKPVGNAAP